MMNSIHSLTLLYFPDIYSSRPQTKTGEEEETFLTLQICASTLGKARTDLNQPQIQNLLNFVGKIQMWIHNFNQAL